MASTTVATRSHPKRKRAEVSYYESSSEESEHDDECDVSDRELNMTTSKKLKTGRPTVPTKPLPKRKVFPFMSLPAELKNQIYALALTDRSGIYLVSKTKRYRREVLRSVPPTEHPNGNYHKSHYMQYLSPNLHVDTTLPTLVPKILLLNKAIYTETQPILYAGNAFAVEDTMAMHTFLANIGSKNCATITDLTIKGWGHSRAHKALNHPAFTMLASAGNLTRLQLDCIITYAGPKGMARQIYRDGFHWLEAVGVGKGKYDAAIDMIGIGDEYLPNSPFFEKWKPEEAMGEFRAELRRLLA